jgi:hypothetical protein
MSESGGATECVLCRKQTPLKRSHIIPRFVSRALQTPDGPTRSLLCSECEDRFGVHESTFARVVFHPLVANGHVAAKYDQWLLPFAVSVCWRILEDALATERAPAWQIRWAAQAAACRETWRQFLIGKRPDVGVHSIHLVLPDPGAGREAIAGQVFANDHEALVCAKLGPVVLIGVVADPHANAWRGTKVHLEGKLKPRTTAIPGAYRENLFPATAGTRPLAS